MSATLIVCKGAREVSREELGEFPVPAPSKRWYPIGHLAAADTVQSCLEEAGYVVSNRRYSVNNRDQKFIGVFDLHASLTDDNQVNLAVAVLNSTNQTWPLGLLIGNRVTCCWNLSMSSDLMSRYSRKHTFNARTDFGNNVARIIAELGKYKLIEARRIARFQQANLTDTQADALLLRMFESGVITSPLLPRVIKEWREPSYDAFRKPTAWSLMNAATTALGERALTNPGSHARATMKLQSLIAGFVGEEPLIPE